MIQTMWVNVNFPFRVQMINSLSGPWSAKEIVNRKDKGCMRITNYLIINVNRYQKKLIDEHETD